MGVLLNILSLTLLLQGVGDVILILQRSCKVPGRNSFSGADQRFPGGGVSARPVSSCLLNTSCVPGPWATLLAPLALANLAAAPVTGPAGLYLHV